MGRLTRFEGLAPLLGLLGGALLGMALLTAFALGGRFHTFLVVQGALGLAGVVLWLVLSGRSLGAVARGRGATFVLTSLLSTLVLGALCVAAVRAAAARNLRWDLTRERIFTLAPDSIAAARALHARTTLLAFLAPAGRPARTLETLVQRYQEYTDLLELKILDPAQHPDLVQRYGVHLAGARMVLEEGKRHVRIKEVSEAAVTTALRALSPQGRRVVYFTRGHGEPSLDDATGPRGLAPLAEALRTEGFEVRPLDLAWTSRVPEDSDLLVCAGPHRPLLGPEVDAIGRYLDAGGRAIFLLDPGPPTGLEPVLEAHGAGLEEGVVVDPEGPGRRLGTGPSVVVVSRYARHPVTEHFDLAVVLPTARALVPLSTASPRLVPLALSAPSAWVEHDPLDQPLERGPGERGGPLPLILVSPAETPSNTASGPPSRPPRKTSRIAIAGESEWVGRQWIDQLGNRDLFLNLAAWLTGQNDRVTIRPRRRASSSLFLTVRQGKLLRLVTVDALPLVLLGLGAIVTVRRRR